MAGDPRMRASYIKDNLSALGSFGADVERQVRSAIPDTVTEIERAARVDWLPIDVDVALTRAVHQLKGTPGVRDWSRRSLLSAVEGPMLRPIVRAVVALFGLTPATVLRRAPMAWQQIYQDCGLLVCEPVSPHEMRLRVEGARGPFLNDGAYVEGTCGTFEGAVDLGGARGVVHAHMDPGAGRVEFTVTW